MFDLGHIGEAIARPRLRPLMAVWALVPLGFAGYTVALPLRAATALGWRERELAILFTIIGITAASVQGYFFGKIVRRTGERALAGGSYCLRYSWTTVGGIVRAPWSPISPRISASCEARGRGEPVVAFRR